MKALTIIPARGGSKGVPGKNTKKLAGKALIHYTIEAAQAIFDNEEIIVSADTDEIINLAKDKGLSVPFKRPDHLASDTASSYDVILHAMDYADSQGMQYDVVVLLQVTSPFRRSEHISEALELYSEDVDMIVSVEESKSNPYYSMFEENDQGMLEKSKASNFTRRQDCPPVYEYNGAIYIMNPKSLREMPIHEFKKVRKYVMSQEASLDIDTQLDWDLAELIASRS